MTGDTTVGVGKGTPRLVTPALTGPCDPRLSPARGDVPRHHAAARRRRCVRRRNRRTRRTLRRHRRRSSGRHRGAQGSSSPHRSPTGSTPASFLPARRANCRGQWFASSTSSSTAPRSSRSIATRSIPTSASSSSTTCSPRVARRSAAAQLIEVLNGQIVGLGFLLEIEQLGGRARLGDRRVESLERY